MNRKLIQVLAHAYHGSDLFHRHVDDPEFISAAREEHDRLSNLEASLGCPLSQRCYASAKHLSYLRNAINAFDKVGK